MYTYNSGTHKLCRKIQGASYSFSTAIENVGVNHGGADVLVPQ